MAQNESLVRLKFLEERGDSSTLPSLGYLNGEASLNKVFNLDVSSRGSERIQGLNNNPKRGKL